jgi:hypothetical protein
MSAVLYIQAQYYWQDETGEGQGSHALCGPPVDVFPGEFLNTRIAYNPDDGSLDISIGPSVSNISFWLSCVFSSQWSSVFWMNEYVYVLMHL